MSKREAFKEYHQLCVVWMQENCLKNYPGMCVLYITITFLVAMDPLCFCVGFVVQSIIQDSVYSFFLFSVPVMTLFMKSVKISSPVVMENITLPCLKVIHHVIKPVPPTSKKNKVRNTYGALPQSK